MVCSSTPPNTRIHTQMLFGHTFMRTCGICAPPHLLSQFLGPTPELPVGGGVGGETGGVEEDTEVGVKASAHLSLLFLGSPTLPLRDTTIQPRVATLGTLCLGLIGLPLFHQEANSNTSVRMQMCKHGLTPIQTSISVFAVKNSDRC